MSESLLEFKMAATTLVHFVLSQHVEEKVSVMISKLLKIILRLA